MNEELVRRSVTFLLNDVGGGHKLIFKHFPEYGSLLRNVTLIFCVCPKTSLASTAPMI